MSKHDVEEQMGGFENIVFESVKHPTRKMVRVGSKRLIEAHRTGWRGAFDAIKAAWRGEKRYTVPAPVEVAIWLSIDTETTKPMVAIMQAEDGCMGAFPDGACCGQGKVETCAAQK